jgi:threonine 3-dehydrogenase
MQALVKTTTSPGLTLQAMPDPHAGVGEVIVRVKATSLCGTDAHIYSWDDWAAGRIRPPRIIGHEMCGEVVELGPGVTTVTRGDYVAAESHFTCGRCFQCRTGQGHVCKNYRILGVDLDGCFAEYVLLPERVLWKTSRGLAPELACLQEPLGNAVHATLTDDISGHTLLITGCGPSGLFAAAIARQAGASHIIATDISDYRLGLAKQLGVDHTLNAQTDSPDAIAAVLQDITAGEGVDTALEMSGEPTALQLVFRSVKNGGRVSLFGIPTSHVSFDLTNDIIFKGIRVHGITGRRLFDTWYRMAGLLQAGLDIRPVVTHTLSLTQFQQGFDLIKSGQCGKVILIP